MSRPPDFFKNARQAPPKGLDSNGNPLPEAEPRRVNGYLVTKPMRWTKANNGRLLPLNSDAWRKLRRRVLAEQPLCAECEVHGELVPSHDIDHQDNDKNNNDRVNLVGLCQTHHSRKTWFEMRGIEYLAPLLHPYNLRPAAGEVTMVCGPAGGGKTTYVKENAASGDVVIDLDAIRASLPFGSTFAQVLEKRNEMLYALAKKPVRAWFIVSSPINNERKWWANKLGTEDVRLLDTQLDVCLERIKASRTGAHLEDSIHAAKKWWAEHRMQQPSKSQSHRAHGCDEDGTPLDPSHPWNIG